MMRYLKKIPDRRPPKGGADNTTLGLLTIIMVAVLLALTFGEAEGLIGLFR